MRERTFVVLAMLVVLVMMLSVLAPPTLAGAQNYVPADPADGSEHAAAGARV